MMVLLGLTAGGCRVSAPAVPPEEAVADGWRWYGGGEFGLAVKAFEAALSGVGTNILLRQQALYGLANTWNLRRPGENLAKAEAHYRDVIAAEPTADLAAWSALALARMRAAPVGGEPVALDVQEQAYQAVADAYPSHPAGEEAFLYQQAARLNDPRAGREREVLAALDAYLTARPATPWRTTIFRLSAHCCEVLGLPERRVAALLQELAANQATAAATSTRADSLMSYWWLATAAHYDLGDFEMARDFYGRLIREYPTDQRVFPAKQALLWMDERERGWLAEDAAGEGVE